MNKIKSTLIILTSILFLTACGGKKVDVTDHIDPYFDGLDGNAIAGYEVDDYSLMNDLFEVESFEMLDKDEAGEFGVILDAFTVEVEPAEDLSNGDTVEYIVTVDSDKTDRIKDGNLKVTVEGLEEPVEVTTEEVEKNLVLNFNGVSGRGEAQIDNVFDDNVLYNIQFKIKNDGELKNGEEATVILDENDEAELNANGYVLADDFNPTFEVKGLEETAESAKEISNYDDVKRYLTENFNEYYSDNDYTKYEVEEEAVMYRQFKRNTDQGNVSTNNEDGNLIGIYSVKSYNKGFGSSDWELDHEFTAIYGFSNIVLDEDKEANLSELQTINDTKESNYSIESVIQLYEGIGYEKVE